MTKDMFKGVATDPQSFNEFVYTKGDPINLVDSSGHDVGSPGVDGATGIPYDQNGNDAPNNTRWYGSSSGATSPTITQGGPTIVPTRAISPSPTKIPNQQLASVIIGSVGATVGVVAFVVGTPVWMAASSVVGAVGLLYQIGLYRSGADKSKANLTLAALGVLPGVFPLARASMSYINAVRGAQAIGLGVQELNDITNLGQAAASTIGYWRTVHDLQY